MLKMNEIEWTPNQPKYVKIASGTKTKLSFDDSCMLTLAKEKNAITCRITP